MSERSTFKVSVSGNLDSWIRNRLKLFREDLSISEYFRLLAELDRTHNMFELVKEFGANSRKIIQGAELKEATTLEERYQTERTGRITAEARLTELEKTLRKAGRIKAYLYIPDMEGEEVTCSKCEARLQYPTAKYFKFWKEVYYTPETRPSRQPGANFL